MAEVIWQGEVDGSLRSYAEHRLDEFLGAVNRPQPEFFYDRHVKGRIVITAVYIPDGELTDVEKA